MSEFQLYRFQTIDRPLTSKEREEINTWSSRAQVTSTSATFVYHYGDFRKNEEKALEEYFDAFLYVSNWGTYRLAFRFPIGSIDAKKVTEFETSAETGYETHLKLKLKKNCWILDFYFADDEGGGWMEEEDFDLGDFLEIRAQIMRGDFRALYLFWMKLACYSLEYEFDEEDFEDEDFDEEDYGNTPPPVPPNLNKLDATLQKFVNFFEIDKDLIAAAASFSKTKKEAVIDYEKLVRQLPENEQLDYLVKLAKEERNLSLTLNRRLRDFMEKSVDKDEYNRPSPLQIFQKSKTKETERKADEAEQARTAHNQKMEKLAKGEYFLWADVYSNIRLKSGKGYDEATRILCDLKDLSVYQQKEAEFKQKIQQIREEYGKSRALLNRLSNKGLW